MMLPLPPLRIPGGLYGSGDDDPESEIYKHNEALLRSRLGEYGPRMKLCTECKWSQQERSRSLRCNRAEVCCSPVDGIRYASPYCADARHKSLCGIEGRLWEPIEENA